METTTIHPTSALYSLPGVIVEDHIEAKAGTLRPDRWYYAIRYISAAGFFFAAGLSLYYMYQTYRTGLPHPLFLVTSLPCIPLIGLFLATTEPEHGTPGTPEQYTLRLSRTVPASTFAYLFTNFDLTPIDADGMFWRAIPKQKG